MREQLYMQQRVGALQRYMRALESGDVETLATLLEDAEQDHALEGMILEVNAAYQHGDHTIVSDDDVAMARQLVLTMAEQTTRREEMHSPALHSEDEAAHAQTESVSSDDYVAKKNGHIMVTPVFPARMTPTRQWYRSPKTWIAAAVATVLIALLLLPGTSVLASQFLSLFRVQQFQPVPITKQDVATLSQYSAPSIDDLGTVQFQAQSFRIQNNLTQSQAAHAVKFALALPRQLPAGIDNTPAFSVIGGGHGVFTFSSAKMHAYLVKNGHGNVQIPANLNGATFDVTTTPGVLVKYGYRTGNPFLIVELPSPVVRATGSASLQELRDFILSLPNLPPQLVAQLKQINLNNGTIPLPVPAGIQTQSVTVHNTSGLLLSSSKTKSVENIEQFPAGNMLVWQENGIIYALGGITVNASQLLAAANSLA